MTTTDLHPIVEAAALTGELPAWAHCARDRYEHSVRVAGLLAGWAQELGLSDRDVARWRATGILHDAVKDADPAELRSELAEEWPAPVVHGPACAARLFAAGVRDSDMLDAIAYHPVGHPDLAELGRYLIMADYLDPGRPFDEEERARLRDRLPLEEGDVLAEVLARRVDKLLRKRRTLMACTVDMWNVVVRR